MGRDRQARGSNRVRGSLRSHSELMPPGENMPLIWSAWDAYLDAAIRVKPTVLESLLTDEAISEVRFDSAAMDQHIAAWCQRWGFDRHYTHNPANNTVVAAKHARRRGEALPSGFVCDSFGNHYPPYDNDHPHPVAYVEFLQDHDGEWRKSPDTRAHPNPLLAERVYACPTRAVAGGTRVSALPPDWAAQEGTQVLPHLPLFFWEPTREPRGAARARIIATLTALLDADLDVVESAYRNQGYQSAPEKRSLEHFEWLARYQLKRETMEEIARGAGVAEQSVSEAINSVKDLLGLALRPPSKTGPKLKRRAHCVRFDRLGGGSR